MFHNSVNHRMERNMRKKLFILSAAAISLCGCVATPDLSDCAHYYPDLPDNEYCFRKIAEFRAFTENPENKKTETYFSGDGKTHAAQVMIPPYTLEGYLGILEGRGAVVKRQLAITPEQSRTIFKSASKLPDFLVDATGNYDADPARYQILTFYCKKDSEKELETWLEQIVPEQSRPRRSVRELFLEKNKDCVLLEPVSPALIEYEWKIRQGDIGKVEGLERRMAGAPSGLVKYVAQMRKWAELDLASPPLLGSPEDWEKFKSLAKDNQPFYCVRHSVETKPGAGGKTETDKISIIIPGRDGEILWEQVLENRKRTDSGGLIES